MAAKSPSVLLASAISASSSSSSSSSDDDGVVVLRCLDAILWDMDGVLADTERDAHRPSFNRIFAEEGLSDAELWTADLYGRLLEVGGGKERMTAHWDDVGWPKKALEWNDEKRQEWVKDLHKRKTQAFMDVINGDGGGDGSVGVPLRPGVARLMDAAINANLTLAVCSTSSEEAVRNLVRTLLGPHRASKIAIFAGDMVTRKKPAPDVYLLAVKTLGLDKTRCVIIEDSAIGLGAANAADIACLVTKSSYTASEDFSTADMVVDDLGDGNDDDNNGDDNGAGVVTLETLEGLVIRKQQEHL